MQKCRNARKGYFPYTYLFSHIPATKLYRYPVLHLHGVFASKPLKPPKKEALENMGHGMPGGGGERKEERNGGVGGLPGASGNLSRSGKCSRKAFVFA
jgi:hypothetical protein